MLDYRAVDHELEGGRGVAGGGSGDEGGECFALWGWWVSGVSFCMGTAEGGAEKGPRGVGKGKERGIPLEGWTYDYGPVPGGC